MSKLEGGVTSRGRHRRFHDRDHEQVPTRGVSAESIMRTADFARGVADKRGGQVPRYDGYNFDQSEGDEAVKVKINGLWNYERGRQWAAVAPLTMPLKIDGDLNSKAVALFRAARQRSYIQ